MVTSKYNIFFAHFMLVSSSIFFTNALTNCDGKLCTGPLYYYQELGCLPIYNDSSSCCATKYNCDHWKNLPDSKCFVNGRVYESGEMIPSLEIGGGCLRCTCNGGNFTATCTLAHTVTLCQPSKPGCHRLPTPLQCCSHIEVCPKKGEDILTCTVDGKTYKDGEIFYPSELPAKICVCGKGYTGINKEPYCITRAASWCGNTLRAVDKVRAHCAPIYEFRQSPQGTCNEGFRCHITEKDFVVEGNTEQEDLTTLGDSATDDPGMMCKFGSLNMKIGQMLNQPEDTKRTMQCVCEVPPVVTCRYLTDEKA